MDVPFLDVGAEIAGRRRMGQETLNVAVGRRVRCCLSVGDSEGVACFAGRGRVSAGGLQTAQKEHCYWNGRGIDLGTVEEETRSEDRGREMELETYGRWRATEKAGEASYVHWMVSKVGVEEHRQDPFES